MDCEHKRQGCVKCGENAVDRGISCCAECTEDSCSARCERAILSQTKSLLESAAKPSHLPHTIEMITTASAFDYSEVDAETASFLRQKETIIGGYIHRTRFDVGQELKEAQEKLAKHRYGCFGKWVASLGLKESTAYELINYHTLILRHAEKRELLESASYTLVREIAKPSADPDLRQKVLDGDITSHKDYQELLRQKREADTAVTTANAALALKAGEILALQNELSTRQLVEIEKPPADYEIVKARALKADRLEREVKRLQISEEKLSEMEGSITALQVKRGDLAAQINATLAINPLIAEAKELVKRIAPMKYSKPLSELRNNEPMKESLLSLVGSVRSWCDEMDDLLIRNIRRAEEVIDVE